MGISCCNTIEDEKYNYCIYSSTGRRYYNFNLTGVQLLIEGDSYLRSAFINFGAILLDDIDTIDSFFRTSFRIFEVYNREISSRIKPGMFSAMFLPQTNDHSWLAIVAIAHPLNYVCACVRLLFLSQSSMRG